MARREKNRPAAKPPVSVEVPTQGADEQALIESKLIKPTLDEPLLDKPTDEAPTDEAPTDEALADEAPADEAPADEAPADEAPADEAPADEAPAAAPAPTPPPKAPPKPALGDRLAQQLEKAFEQTVERLWIDTLSRAVDSVPLLSSLGKARDARLWLGTQVRRTGERVAATFGLATQSQLREALTLLARVEEQLAEAALHREDKR